MKTAATKIDLKRQYKALYAAPPGQVQILDVPKLRFIMVDGVGDPSQGAFQSAVQTLYNLAYTVKFGLKKAKSIEFPVMALEGLWSTNPQGGFDSVQREKWQWTLMIMQPNVVTADVVREAVEEIRRKGKPLGDFRLDEFQEGLAAQILHVGPYSTESSSIEKIRDYMKENNYSPNGRHHEIYLGDPRRAAPSKLRTILRQPIRHA
jgi:hypothetical protein